MNDSAKSKSGRNIGENFAAWLNSSWNGYVNCGIIGSTDDNGPCQIPALFRRQQIVSTPGETIPPASDFVSAANSGIELPSPKSVSDADSQLNLEHDGSRVHVAFNYKDVPDEARVAGYRSQLVGFIQRT